MIDADVYTDGACKFNGYPNAVAGIGVYWGPDHAWSTWNVSELVTGGRHTNQIAELQAILRAIRDGRRMGCIRNLRIFTDSKYAHSCLTLWIYKWLGNGFKNVRGTEVCNSALIQETMSEYIGALASGMYVEFIWIPGNAGVLGNLEADRLARVAVKAELVLRIVRRLQAQYIQDANVNWM
eukprot:TRINITY_DN3758_c0_g1_i5.p1 TRINITY_DN3758_c0_g1~~TRINITY_DN3758_c0_g1_i5.p1  ORF type:complete len:181 (+),score=28.30 TRINITY_DN3758_c0_g1_i5:47-589(+)